MALKKLSKSGRGSKQKSLAGSRRGISDLRKDDSKASFIKKDQTSNGSKKSLSRSMTKDDSKEKLALKKSPTSSTKKGLKLKSMKSSKRQTPRESPNLEIDDVPEQLVMKEINFAKEKYMSSKRVADLLKIGGGVTLFDKHEVTKGPDISLSSRHMSLKNFNLQCGDH